MKKLLILFFILISFVSYSQNKDTTDAVEYIEPDTTSVLIDIALTKLVLQEFIEDAQKYGLDTSKVKNHIMKLDFIYLAELESGKIGMTVAAYDTTSCKTRGIILLDFSLIPYYDYYKMTLYHELGHWFGLEHKRRGIMRSKHDSFNFEEWDKYVKKLMKRIKRAKKDGEFSLPDIKISF